MSAKPTTPLSPALIHYYATKKSLSPCTLLAIRLGDFYEFLGDDAKIAAPLLGLTLTKRGEFPMCGFPVFALERIRATLAVAGQAFSTIENLAQAQPMA